MTNPNDAAFGQPFLGERENGSSYTYSTGGLTKREYFAAMAMQGNMAGRYGSGEVQLFRVALKELANESVALADALIAELSKEKQS